MTKVIESVKIGANPRCGYCQDWLREQLQTYSVGACSNFDSDHFGHTLAYNHPACKCYCKRRMPE